jgi:tetratricopeptide (TPR) repeat protein
MDWTTVLLALIPSILLLAQGTACLKRPSAPPYVRQFGYLCVLLSGLSFILCLLLASGTLVLSAEFGIVMVQGPWGRFGLATLLIGSTLGAALGHHVCDLEAGRLTRLHWPKVIGLIVGLLAAGRLLPLNPDDANALHIYAYDLWWPPLLIYFIACLVDSALYILRVRPKPIRLWVATTLVGGMTLLALSQPALSETTPATIWRGYLFLLFPVRVSTMWKGCLLLLFPASVSMVTWLFFRIPRQRLTLLQGWSRQVLTWLPAGIGILSCVFWAWGSSLSPLMTSWPWLLWLSWPLLVGLVTPHQLSRAWRAGQVDWQALPRPTVQQSIMLMAIAVLAMGFAALVSFVRLDRTLILTGFVIAWILVAEAIARGPLSHIMQRLIDQQELSNLGLGVLSIGRRLASWLKSLLSVPSMPVLIGKALIGMAILVALNELPNAHKTLIQPFKVIGLPERSELGKDASEREEAGRAISERVVNTLGLLQEELRQEIVLSLQPDSDSEDGGGRKKFALTSVGDSTSVSAALSKSTELEIGGAKIPMSLLFTPVQGPIRWLLGVRSITASVQSDHGGFALLARSDAGETWTLVASPDKQARPEDLASPEIMERSVVSMDKLSLPAALVSPELTEPSKVQIYPEPIGRLADELAFHIIRSDELLAPALTKSWGAFEPFKKGLREWKEFETEKDYDAIGQAIRHFREAIQEDPGFAFAHYRLGLALQKDGQPGLAVKAFRASLKADPSLIPAYIALASTLYDFERTSFLAEIGSPLDFLRRVSPEAERIEEARDLWLKVLRLPERGDSMVNLGAAYYGLCRQASRQGRKEAHRTPQQEEKRSDPGEDTQAQDLKMTPKQWYHMAYYYCKRAEALYASLATAPQANLEAKKGEAYVLSTLGVILSNIQRRRDASPADMLADFQGRKEASPADQPVWKCWIGKESKFPSREGLEYFTRALDLLPDDYRLRCYAARTAYELGDRRPLEQLEKDAQAHLHKANAHRRLAKVCAAIDREELSPPGRARLKTPSYRRYVQLCKPKEVKDKNAQPHPEARVSEIAEQYQSALHEYREVIDREPMNIEALTSYAYTVWEWLTYAGHDKQFHGRIEYYAEHALSHALKAVGLAESSTDNREQHLARSSLGKALLARGSCTGAIAELAQVVNAVPNHPAFHEMHWALAQAYLCAASYEHNLGFQAQAVQSEKRGWALMGNIFQQEGVREFQLFSSRPPVPDSALGKLICQPRLGIEILPHPPTVAMKTVLTATADRK